jgi:hypothetical protein
MSLRHHFVARGAKGPRFRHPGQCILLSNAPRLAFVANVAGNRAILETECPPAIGSRVELHHPVAGVIVGNVVETLAKGVAVAFNAGDRAIAFALNTLARDIRT